MATLIRDLGLVGTSIQLALKRGESIVFYDVAPRKIFWRISSARQTSRWFRRDVRDLPALVETMQKHKVDKVIHSGLIGGKVAQPLYSGLQINVMGTINAGGGAAHGSQAARANQHDGHP